MGGLNTKGDRRERELVNRLDEAGFAVMRAPASGSATERDLPDVLAGNGESFYAIEAKSSGGNPIYLEKQELDGLTFFATNFGATPKIGIRYDWCEWRFFDIENVHRTEAGSARVKKDRIDAGEGENIDDLRGGA